MRKARKYLSYLFYKKKFWQILLALLIIGLAIFFILHENIELGRIRSKLENSNPFYIFLGVLLTIVYLVFQGEMYVHSFRSLNAKLPLRICIRIFLKRNFISVFLPAGGFSSLTFFANDAVKHNVSRSKIHLASTIFAICSILSVVALGIPVLSFAMAVGNISNPEITGFIFLILLTVGLLIFIYSLSKRARAYKWISKMKPSMLVILDEMISEKIIRKEFWKTFWYSIAIEIIGIVHLYIAMKALGFDASWQAAIIGYLVMVVILIASPFLRGLGAIEVSLTFVLSHYGFPVVAAAAITLLYRFFEFWLPFIAGIGSFFVKKDNLVMRVLPAFIILVLGIINIISAITPAIPARLSFINNLISPAFVNISNSLVLIFGFFLIILSGYLLKGSKRAWFAAIILTLFSLIGNLLKGVDYEEGIFAFVAAGSLLLTRKNYKLKPHPRLTRVSYQIFLYSLIAVLAYGVIGFYFIDRKHFGMEFEFWESVKAIFRIFFLIGDPKLQPLTKFGGYFLQSIYFAGFMVLIFIIYGILRPYITKPFNSEEDKITVAEIVKRFGKSALDYFKVYPDKYFFISEDRNAFISFKLSRHFAMVLEDPVCENQTVMREMILKFDDFCEENGFINAWYRVPESSLSIYLSTGKKALPIGEEATVNLPLFSMEGKKNQPTRSAINRLHSEGFELKIYSPPIKEGILQKIEQVSENWLKELGEKEVAFTQGVFDASELKKHTIITVEDKEERIYAFLNLVPDYSPGETTYDLIRKISNSPNGVLDMLMVKTLEYLKDAGYGSMNMGLAPLSGIEGEKLVEKTAKYAYEHLRSMKHFKGLRKFKEKFHPMWEKKYLIYNHDYHLLQVPHALRKVSKGY